MVEAPSECATKLGTADTQTPPPPKRAKKDPLPPRGRVLSNSPRIVHYERLLSDEHCDHLIQLAESRGKWFDGRPYGAPEYCAQFLLPLDRFFDPVVRRVEEIIGEITCVAPHNDEDPMKCSRHQAPREDSARRGAPLLNVHHDRNDVKPRRIVTAIIYLSDVEQGGGTYFPLAEPAEQSEQAGGPGANGGEEGPGAPGCSVGSAHMGAGEKRRRATALREALRTIYETSGGATILPAAPGSDLMTLREAAAIAVIEADCAAAARAMARHQEEACTTRPLSEQPMWVFGKERGLLVRSVKGSAIVFWSVRQDSWGDVETAAAWHGAATVEAGVKFSVQKFKESPVPAGEAGER